MAHWIIEDYGFGGNYYRCSTCRCSWNDLYEDVSLLDACPNCGTPINEEENEYKRYNSCASDKKKIHKKKKKSKWNLFSEKKPKKNGWYQCTVEVPGLQRYVMDLYWYSETQRFKDNRRQDVFSTYSVYNKDHELMHNESLCDRTHSVIAWRNMPKPYMKGFVKDY